MIGTEPERLVGRNGFDLIHPDDQARASEAFRAIADRGSSVRIELRVLDEDGQVRWVEEVATNLLEEPGVAAVVGHLRDITARKEIETAVDLQASLLEAVGQAVVAWDRAGRVIYWNEAATGLFGWSAEEALGRETTDLVTVVAEGDGAATEGAPPPSGPGPARSSWSARAARRSPCWWPTPPCTTVRGGSAPRSPCAAT